MPTEDQILVPETLLKKRKSQEKQREERQAEIEKKKKVRYTATGDAPKPFPNRAIVNDSDDNHQICD